MRASARRAFADSRVRNGAFTLLFAVYAYANAVGYRRTYATAASRIAFAHAFGDNAAVRLFYGVPHDLLTVGGYCAWRVGGIATVIASVWGVLAAVRALRAEEEAGRTELVLAEPVGRSSVYAGVVAAVAAGAAGLFLGLFAGLVGGRLDAGGAAFLALAVVSPVPVFAGVGALASQVAPTRRLALELGIAVVAVAFLLRVVADTASGLGALRWLTPLGWAELLRPFAGPRPIVLLLPALVGSALVAGAGAIATRRDVGNGLLPDNANRRARLQLLGSPMQLDLRSERGTLTAWGVGVASYALVVGLLSTSLTTGALSANLRRALEKLTGSASLTPATALGLYFSFFVVAISAFTCSQVAAARREEADGRLETLFAQPVARRRWLAGRIALGAAGVAGLALLAAVFAWAGAASKHAGVSLPHLLEAGANCIPAALLFLGLGALAYAALPRAGTGIAYGVLSVAYLWQVLADLVGAPRVLRDMTPFRHVALVPAQPFRPAAAALMLAVAVLAAGCALRVFERRDLAV